MSRFSVSHAIDEGSGICGTERDEMNNNFTSKDR